MHTNSDLKSPTLADKAIHVGQHGSVAVELAILGKAPELHARHGEGVIGTLLVPQLTVEVVDLAQAADVASDHIHHLAYKIQVCCRAMIKQNCSCTITTRRKRKRFSTIKLVDQILQII